MTIHVGQDEVLPRDASPEMSIVYFWYWRRCHVPSKWRRQPPHIDVFLSRGTSFLFFLFFISTKIHLTPHKIYKRKQSAKNIDTSKDNNIYFKIQEYFGNLVMLKEKIKKSLLLKQSKILLPWVFRTYIMQSREEKIYISLSILQY
jgi:hypothetical protein